MQSFLHHQPLLKWALCSSTTYYLVSLSLTCSPHDMLHCWDLPTSLGKFLKAERLDPEPQDSPLAPQALSSPELAQMIRLSSRTFDW